MINPFSFPRHKRETEHLAECIEELQFEIRNLKKQLSENGEDGE